MNHISLVTGGAGFIGSHLTRALLERGDCVRVIDNFSSGRRQNLAGLSDRLEVVDADIRDEDACRAACRGVDYVYHLAALGSVPRSIEDPLTTDAVNVHGTLNVLVASREASVRRVVFASSSSVYGDTVEPCKHEEMRPRPLSPYAVSKIAGEHYCRTFTLCYGLQCVALRFFNVYGPRQDPNSPYAAVIPRFVTALLYGRQPTIFGDGGQTRDFTYVENVVDALQLASTARDAEGRAFNVACGDEIAVSALLEDIAAILGVRCEPIHAPARRGDVRKSRADVSLARQVLGYDPKVGFAEGLHRTVQAFRTASGDPAPAQAALSR